MKLLALDQSLKIVGWCVYDTDDNTITAYGSKVFNKGKTVTDLDERINDIANFTFDLIKQYKIEVFCVEDTQMQANAKVYKDLCKLLGVLCHRFYKQKFLYIIVKPSEWKGFCGIKGKKRDEQKTNTIQYVYDTYNINVTADEADAIGIALYANHIYQDIK